MDPKEIPFPTRDTNHKEHKERKDLEIIVEFFLVKMCELCGERMTV